MSGNGISWAICKSAPRSRQITTPAPHHSVFTGRMPFLSPNQQRQSTHTHTHTRLTALFSGTTQVSRDQKGKTNLDFNEARDSEWQWHQLGHMQVCTSLQRDNQASTPPLKKKFFFTGRMPFLPPNQQRQSTEGTQQRQSIEGNTLHCIILCWTVSSLRYKISDSRKPE